MEIEFDVKITSGVLYDYMLRHTYSSFSGILGTVLGILLIVFSVQNHNYIYLAGGIVILLYLPISLWLRAANQAKNNPAFRELLHYKLTSEGIEVSQNGEVQSQHWGDFYRAVSTKTSVIVYTTKVNACIFPRKDMDDKASAVIQMIATNMSPSKVKIRW